jgi:ABC-2 type transport system permease protein
MNIKRINALMLRHLYIYKRSMPRLMDVFFWPVMELLTWGFFSFYLGQTSLQNFNIATMLLGGVILWQVVDRAQNSISVYFLEDVWHRNFLNIFVTPLRLSEFFAAGAMLAVLRIIVMGGFLSLVSYLLYKFNIFVLGMSLIPFMFNLFLFGMVIGLFINGIILRFGSSAQILAFGISFLIQPISAAFYPISSLPAPLAFLSQMLPVSYIFESMRAVISGGSIDWHSFNIALILNIVYLVIMWIFFSSMFKKVKKLGKLLKVQD